MSRKFDAELWREISRHFDEVLDLPYAARDAYLRRIRGEKPQCADELQALLNVSEQPAASILDAPAMAALASHTAPRRIGAWQLQRLLGRGGMGEVWYAERSADGFVQRAAIKFIPEALVDLARRQRFAVERGILSRLQHPNIAQLVDGGEYASGMLWYAMEFVDGTDIVSHCDALRLGVAQRATLFVKLCEAVAFAHQHLIVHRDIKPRNVLVTADGQLKLIDFGIAKLLDIDSDALTQEASPMTPRYAAPEQLKGEAVTTASDIWQLGALLHELLIGAAPHADKETDVPAASRRAQEIPPAIAAMRRVSSTELSTALRGDADAILLRALRNEPAARYGSAQQLADDVNCWLSGAAVTARRGERWYGMRRFWRRHWLPSSAFAVVFVALIVVTMVATTFAQRSRRDALAAENTLAAMRSMFLSDASGPEAQDMSVSQLFANAVDVLRKDRNIPVEKRYALLRDISVRTIEVGQGPKGRQGLREAVAMAVAAFGPQSLQALAEKAILAKELAGYSPTPQAIAESGALLDETEPALRRMGDVGATALLEVHRARIVVQIRRREFAAALQTAEMLDRLTDTLPDYSARQRLDDRYMHVQALEWNDREHDALLLLRKSISEAQESAAAEPSVLGGVRWMRVQLCGTLPEDDAEAAIHECEAELARMNSENNDTSFSGYEVRFAIARALGILHRYDAAIDAGLEAKRVLDKVADAKAADFTHARFARFLGEMYAHSGRHAEAIPLLEHAIAIAAQGSADSQAARVEMNIELAQSYAATGHDNHALVLLDAQEPDIDKASRRHRDAALALRSKLDSSAKR